MRISGRGGVSIAVVVGAALLLSGCASSGVTTTSVAPTSESIAPIQNSSVASSDLTVLPGTQVQPASIGQPLTPPGPTPGAIGQSSVPGQQPTQVAGGDASFVTLGNAPSGASRDLSTGLTVEKLLGGWTVVQGTSQCRINLTQMEKVGTARFRASLPGCGLPGLSVVSSWQLLGNQVQLFDENNDIIASLIVSGNRFIGTLAGGQGISMVS